MTTLLRFVAALLGLALSPPVFAQSASDLVMPREVVLYVQSDLPETGFIDPLVCALERVLTVPIRVETSRMSIGPDLLLRGRQYDVDAIAARFGAEASKTGEPAFRHLIVRQDIAARGYNFLFASRFGGGPKPERIQVASTARLRERLEGRMGHEISDALAARLYKIVLRGVVHGTGYGGQGCVLAYSNSYPEFNTKTIQLCSEDKTRLIEAGLVREEEKADCAPAVARLDGDARRGRERLKGS